MGGVKGRKTRSETEQAPVSALGSSLGTARGGSATPSVPMPAGQLTASPPVGVDAALRGFSAVGNGFFSAVVRGLPWVALALAAAIGILEYGIREKPSLPKPNLTITALAAAALGAYLMRRMLESVPKTLALLWNRQVLRPLSDGADHDLESEYTSFIRWMHDRMNSLAGICAVAVAVLALTSLATFPPGNDVPKPTWYEPGVLSFLLVAVLIGAVGWRMIVVSAGIRRLGMLFDFRVQPMHPDRSGGLKSLGDICLTNALIITIPAAYVVVRLAIDPQDPDTHALLLGFVPAVMVLAALVFLRPLWAVHEAMLREVEPLRARLEAIAKEASTLGVELLEQSDRLPSAELEERHKRQTLLIGVYEQSRHLPTWPFPRTHVYAFLSSQLIPVLGLVGVGLDVAIQ